MNRRSIANVLDIVGIVFLAKDEHTRTWCQSGCLPTKRRRNECYENPIFVAFAPVAQLDRATVS